MSEPDPIYSSLADDPVLAELVEMFVQEMPSRIADLETHAESGDWQQLGRAAHQLKGACGSYGFGQITPYAMELEAVVRQECSEAEVRRSLAGMIGICRRVQAKTPLPAKTD